MSNNNLMTSADFAKEIGVTAPTLLRWEKQGLFKPYLVTLTGRRFYRYEQVKEYYDMCIVKKED